MPKMSIWRECYDQPHLGQIMSRLDKIIVLSGIPYAGKSRLLAKFTEDSDNNQCRILTRVTTRPRRIAEDDQPRYIFTDEREFMERMRKGEFVVVEKNFGYHYGTVHGDLKHAMDSGIPPIVVTNVKDGFRKISSHCPKCLLVFITPILIGKTMDFEEDVLNQVLSERICKRQCACSLDGLISYSVREINLLKEFPMCKIIYNAPGASGLSLAYNELKLKVKEYLADY